MKRSDTLTWRVATSRSLRVFLLAAALTMISGCSGPTWAVEPVGETLSGEQGLKLRSYFEVPIWIAIWGFAAFSMARESATAIRRREAGGAAGSAGCSVILLLFAALAAKPAYHVLTRHDSYVLSPQGITENTGGGTAFVRWTELEACRVSEETVSSTTWRSMATGFERHERTVVEALACRSGGEPGMARKTLRIPLERRTEQDRFKVLLDTVFGSDDFRIAPADRRALLDFVRKQRPEFSRELGGPE